MRPPYQEQRGIFPLFSVQALCPCIQFLGCEVFDMRGEAPAVAEGVFEMA